MKKLFSVLMLAILMLAFSSCQKSNVSFKFDLDVSSYVTSPSTGITSEFAGYATNDSTIVPEDANAEYLLLSSVDQHSDIVKDFDKYIYNTFVAKEKANASDALYKITVKGYVEENLTGLRLQVHKVFTNIEGKDTCYYIR